jgi:anti-anti-sigma factor
MEITRRAGDGWLELAVEGRLDGYWADHLDASLAESVRDGYHRLHLDLSQVVFMSSAGIAVLVKFHKQLDAIHGRLVVVKLSAQVRTVLEITRLADLLVDTSLPAGPEALTSHGAILALNDAVFQVFPIAPGSRVTCRTITAAHPGSGPAASVALKCPDSTLAVGIGAFGASDAECRGRFGELLAVGGAAMCLAGDGTETPDYLMGEGQLAPEVRLLSGLACEGPFESLARFEPITPKAGLTLAGLADAWLHVARSDAASIAMVAETSGLVGAALRESPGARSNGDFFAFPGVRRRLTFTAERAFPRSIALVVGVVQRDGGPITPGYLRSLGGGSGLSGHFHAAAFPFRAFKKGRMDLHQTVGTLLAAGMLGVLHLIHDDRPIVGVGQSEFTSGACWIGPIGKAAA